MTKFETVLINPPYQSKGHKAHKAWIDFVDKFSAVAHALFLTPESIFTANTEKISALREKIMPRIDYVTSQANNHFSVGERVCGYILLANERKDFEYISKEGHASTIMKRNGPYNFSEDGEKILAILRKIEGSGHPRLQLQSDVPATSAYQATARVASGEISGAQSSQYPYPLLHSLGKDGSYYYAKTPFPSSGKLKVVIPYSASYGKFELVKDAIGQQVEGILVKDEAQGKVVISNLNHPIFHFYIANEKSGGFNTGIFKLPDINFKKAWGSKALYEEFAFTKEEIVIIGGN